MRICRLSHLILIPALLASTGCSTLKARSFVAHGQRPVDAVQFFEKLDQIVHQSHVEDASGFRIFRFPYLRTDRFLAALRKKINTEDQKTLWVERMRELDLQARKKEITNLPESSVKALTNQFNLPSTRDALIKKISLYSSELLQHDQKQNKFYSILSSSLNRLPGEYSFSRRIIGLYPLFALPIIAGTESAHNNFRQWHNSPLEKLSILGEIKIYTPKEMAGTSSDIRLMFSQSNRDALGLPQLTDDDIQKLFAAFAPVYHQDVVADYDRFGRIFWNNGHVTIDTQKAVVYYYLSYAFIAKKPVMQLNYVIWYQGRYGNNAPWIERGKLDGFTIRITLDTDGEPTMADTMNNCGCYHFFVPRQEKIEHILSHAFVPTWLPNDFPSKRLHLRINSGWHQIQHIDTFEKTFTSLAYELIPYDTLESLPKENGQHENVFLPQGIMKDSSRIEPFFFFSSGIPAIGFMRERGHHAIKMVGQEYFDEPELFNKNFLFR